MPYWKCPKCDSTENYLGTEIVTEVKGSGGGRAGGFIGSPIGESGITPMIGGSKGINITSSTAEKTVRRCKKCDTLLGEKDQFKTIETVISTLLFSRFLLTATPKSWA